MKKSDSQLADEFARQEEKRRREKFKKKLLELIKNKERNDELSTK